MNELATAANELLASVEERASGKLSPADRALILSLTARGQTQAAVATIIGCDQSTVSRVISRYKLDTRADARALLEASALEMAESVVTKGDPALHAKMLGKLDVVRDDKPQSGVDSGVVVIIGQPGQPVGLPVMPVIEARVSEEQ